MNPKIGGDAGVTPSYNLNDPQVRQSKLNLKPGKSSIAQRIASNVSAMLAKFTSTLKSLGKAKYREPAIKLLQPNAAQTDRLETMNALHGKQGLSHLQQNKDLVKTKMGARTHSSAEDRKNMRIIQTAMLLHGCSPDDVKAVRSAMRNALNAGPRPENRGRFSGGAHHQIAMIANNIQSAYADAGNPSAGFGAAHDPDDAARHFNHSFKGALGGVNQFMNSRAPKPNNQQWDLQGGNYQSDDNKVLGQLHGGGLID